MIVVNNIFPRVALAIALVHVFSTSSSSVEALSAPVAVAGLSGPPVTFAPA
jgi:hypothetical protein